MGRLLTSLFSGWQQYDCLSFALDHLFKSREVNIIALELDEMFRGFDQCRASDEFLLTWRDQQNICSLLFLFSSFICRFGVLHE